MCEKICIKTCVTKEITFYETAMCKECPWNVLCVLSMETCGTAWAHGEKSTFCVLCIFICIASKPRARMYSSLLCYLIRDFKCHLTFRSQKQKQNRLIAWDSYSLQTAVVIIMFISMANVKLALRLICLKYKNVSHMLSIKNNLNLLPSQRLFKYWRWTTLSLLNSHSRVTIPQAFLSHMA